jgi:hypothetical protein
MSMPDTIDRPATTRAIPLTSAATTTGSFAFTCSIMTTDPNTISMTAGPRKRGPGAIARGGPS